MDIQTIINSAIECHLWVDVLSEMNDDDIDARGMEVDTASASNIAEEVRDFVESNREDLIASSLDDEQIGIDFALTRNGHGAGFWDRGLGDIGERLTEASKPYGSIRGWISDDIVFFE